VGCPFCATGTLGFKKNLSASEIIEQVLFMQNLSGERIDNIVYMGQGEPLNNYDEVIASIDMMRNHVGIGARHITVSTSGVIPRIDKLAEENLQITLALSLHDPTDEDRNFLVPINKKWPVFELIDSLKRYYKKTKRRVTIEYVMLDGINDSFEKAKILGELVRDLHCNINLIPYNQTDVEDPFKRSKQSTIKRFAEILNKTSGNKTVTIRRERGHDINAACGQLANKLLDLSQNRS
jgi:23S rRNA (adenine2503-C2)-methyltransferase